MNDSTSFERRLSDLFDRQRFFRNSALDAFIAETESRCFGGRSLTDDDLDLVSATGAFCRRRKLKLFFKRNIPFEVSCV